MTTSILTAEHELHSKDIPMGLNPEVVSWVTACFEEGAPNPEALSYEMIKDELGKNDDIRFHQGDSQTTLKSLIPGDYKIVIYETSKGYLPHAFTAEFVRERNVVESVDARFAPSPGIFAFTLLHEAGHYQDYIENTDLIDKIEAEWTTLQDQRRLLLDMKKGFKGNLDDILKNYEALVSRFKEGKPLKFDIYVSGYRDLIACLKQDPTIDLDALEAEYKKREQDAKEVFMSRTEPQACINALKALKKARAMGIDFGLTKEQVFADIENTFAGRFESDLVQPFQPVG